MQLPTVSELFANHLHYGHPRTKFNPHMKQFVFGNRNGMSIIDLEKTAEHLQIVLEYISRSYAEGKTIMFVGTKPQAAEAVRELATKLGMPHVTRKWLPGFLTNFATVKKSMQKLEQLEVDAGSGMWELRYTKKEAAAMQKEYQRLRNQFDGVRGIIKRPDIIFAFDVTKERKAVLEGAAMGVPVVGIVDTNSSPEGLLHFVPANDDSVKGLRYLCDLIAKACGK